MVEIRVELNDPGSVRFAYHPLLEIALSYRILQSGFDNPEYEDWIAEARKTLYGIKLDYLDALVAPHGYIPDFITPAPVVNHRSIEGYFDEIRATPVRVIRENILTLIKECGDTPLRRMFLTSPGEAVERLLKDMALYWGRAIAPYWTQMVSILENDVNYRGRLLALEGISAALTQLNSNIVYEDAGDNWSLVCKSLSCDNAVDLTTELMYLVPIVFNSEPGCVFQVSPYWEPMFGYTARGSALLQDNKPPISIQSLEKALGAARAQVLQALATPLNTSELAVKLHLTAGTVSQHLDRLKEAGLVEPQRSGKKVFYHLTSRGSNLLALFDMDTQTAL